MNTLLVDSISAVTCDQARVFEARLLGKNEWAEWNAMEQAGRGVAEMLLLDFEELGGFPATGRILAVVGKGHNGGDALITTRLLLQQFPRAQAEICFVFGEQSLRPLAKRAWRDLITAASSRVVLRRCDDALGTYDLCLDGLFGFQYRPPLDPAVARFLGHVNRSSVRLRAAIDLPSGWDAPDAFRADFTYATGLLKRPLFSLPNAGRLRLVDLGWTLDESEVEGAPRVLLPRLLEPLSRLRASAADKRTFGHVGIVGGSRNYPGAVLMAVKAALRSGVGLVTAFVPESLTPAFAAAAPEAMWVGWPETPSGSLSLEGAYLLREKMGRVTAWVVGPGLGREPETLICVKELLGTTTAPVVIDAEALQADLVHHGSVPRILTPHAGEWARISKRESIESFAAETNAVVVAKGPLTAVVSGWQRYYSLAGGPVLARGGSGDVLAGLVGGLLAQDPENPLSAAARGVLWHGLTADHLARAQGQTAVVVTDLIPLLASTLRATSTQVRST
ncbi:MAG: NAD(P)H-hydrate dehydratase [Opitutaceae bacterium]